MAGLRQRYTVAWDDGPDVDILTTMRDVITAVDLVANIDDIENTNRGAAETAIIWSALKRAEHPVPTYTDWLLVLDHYRPVPGVDLTEGPTLPDLSPTAPSPSLSSPAPTGGPGSTKTPAPSKPRKRSSSRPAAARS